MTGDLGWLDEGGYLRITGRKKDVIIRGGHNINPARIEELVMQHRAVERAAAIPVADGGSGRRSVSRSCSAQDKRSLRSKSSDHLNTAGLTKYEMPEFFIELPEIPLMPNGKIQKQTFEVAHNGRWFLFRCAGNHNNDVNGMFGARAGK